MIKKNIYKTQTKNKRALLIFLTFLMIGISLQFALAIDLTLNVYDISPSSVEPDEDFTVGVQIENIGDNNVEDVVLEVKSIGEDIELKEDKIVNIGRLRSNGGLKNIVYNFHTAHNAVDGNRNIELKLSWRGSNSEAIQSKEYSFSVLIRGDEPELTISKIKSSPEKIMEKEDVILTYDIENYGEATAKNVRIFLEGLKFQGTKEAYLGEIEPHESLPARFILVAGKNGEQNYNLKIMYETHGLEKEKDFPLKITVFNKSQLSYWIGGIILFSAFVLYYIYLRKPKKRK